MATHKPEPILGRPAAAILAACTFVSQNSSGQWAQTAAGAQPDGILPAASESVGDFCRAWLGGYGAQFKAPARASIAVNALVAVGTTGGLITAATGNVIIGKAISAGASGDMVEFIWFGYRGVAP